MPRDVDLAAFDRWPRADVTVPAGEPNQAPVTSAVAVPQASEHLAAVTETIRFNENAEDPFENTVRLDVYSYELLKQLDPALGLQYGWFTTDTVGKSHWVLTDKLKTPITGYENVLDTPDYKVYRHIH